MFLIALGSNLPSEAGSSARTLVTALNMLPDAGLMPVAVSRFYRSAAFPAGSGPDYVNACAVLRSDTAQTPDAVLAALHHIEAVLGRVRDRRWQARKVDLDLLAAGNTVLPDAETQRLWRDLPLDRQMREAPTRLIVPHPRLQDRAFVLIPLAEIAPLWRHPLTGHTVKEMCDALPDDEKSGMMPVSAPFGKD
ncbi:MAG TPA: 2-amino-4-hydroxy-6-hydroxymethyldihydropteridine diphosphokinase [Paenirhodobacter sp.]